MADTGSPFFIPYVEPTDLVRDYPAADEAQADAIAGQFGKGFQFAGQRIYTSSGTFVKADPLGTGDIGLRAIKVRLVGGGGGGGGTETNDAQGAGGGGGGYAEKFIIDLSLLSASETVTIGAGGAGGGSNADGSAGGDTTFLTLTGAGGSGGPFFLNTVFPNGGSGGSGSGGDIDIRGSGGGAATNTRLSGFGGASHLGGGGLSLFRRTNGSFPGQDGGQYGGAGSGAMRSGASAGAGTGGSGASGIVIVECYA